MPKGLLIAFEGIDGCGKGTQIELLKAHIAEEGWGDRVVMFKQPGGTAVGDEMRRVLFESVTTHNMTSNAASLLYLVSHVEGVDKVVKPALEAGKIVVSDRWDAYSAVAFGMCAMEPPASPAVLKAHADCGGVTPDLTFFLHGDPAVFLQRALARTAETHQSGKRWANVKDLTRIQDVYYKLMDQGANVQKISADKHSARQISDWIVVPTVRRAIRQNWDL